MGLVWFLVSANLRVRYFLRCQNLCCVYGSESRRWIWTWDFELWTEAKVGVLSLKADRRQRILIVSIRAPSAPPKRAAE